MGITQQEKQQRLSQERISFVIHSVGLLAFYGLVTCAVFQCSFVLGSMAVLFVVALITLLNASDYHWAHTVDGACKPLWNKHGMRIFEREARWQ